MEQRDLSTYYSLKPKIKTGDLLEFAPDSTLGKVIRLKTHSDVSHTGMVVSLPYEELKDYRHVLEVTEVGTCINILYKRLKYYKGSVFWLPLKEEYDEVRYDLAIWALLNTCSEFPTRKLLRALLEDVLVDYDKFMCNEYYFLNLKENNLVTGDVAPHPGDFMKFGIHKPRIQLV